VHALTAACKKHLRNTRQEACMVLTPCDGAKNRDDKKRAENTTKPRNRSEIIFMSPVDCAAMGIFVIVKV